MQPEPTERVSRPGARAGHLLALLLALLPALIPGCRTSATAGAPGPSAAAPVSVQMRPFIGAWTLAR